MDALKSAERFGIPLIEGAPLGEVVKPVAPGKGGDEDEDADDEKQAKKKGKAGKALATASGLPVASTSGFVEGQTFIDDVVDQGVRAVGAEMARTLLAELADVIDGAETYEDIRAAVFAHYADAAPPAAIRDLVQKALVLSELAGAAAVRQDA